MHDHSRYVVRYTICAIIAAVLSFGEYVTLGKVLDQLVALNDIILLLCLYTAFACVSRLFVVLYKREASNHSISITGRIRDNLVDYALDKQQLFTKEDGSFLHAFTNGTQKIGEFLGWLGTTFIPGLISGVVVSVFALTISWKLMLCFVIGLPLFIWFTNLIAERLKRRVSEMEKGISEHEIKVQRDIRLYEEWIALGLTRKVQTDHLSELKVIDKNKRKVALTRKLAWFISNLQEQYSRIITFIFGGYLLMRGEISIGMLLAFNVYSDSIKQFFALLFEVIPKWKETSVYVERINDYMKNDNSEGKGKTDYKTEDLLSIRKLSVAINGKEILHEIDISIRGPQLTCIVGRSGSGKTTLANIVAGLIQSTTGSMYIKGDRDSDKDQWSGIYYIPQFTYLFPANMLRNFQYSNIAQGNMPLTLAEDAAFRTDVNRAIESHGGWLADLTDANDIYSGGEKKRIAIAQGLANPFQLIILDEPFAGLDAGGRMAVRSCLLDLQQQNISIVIITHDYEICSHADWIIVMDEGRIAAQGTHDELMQSSPIYRLLRSQTDEKDDDDTTLREDEK